MSKNCLQSGILFAEGVTYVDRLFSDFFSSLRTKQGRRVLLKKLFFWLRFVLLIVLPLVVLRLKDVKNPGSGFNTVTTNDFYSYAQELLLPFFSGKFYYTMIQAYAADLLISITCLIAFFVIADVATHAWECQRTDNGSVKSEEQNTFHQNFILPQEKAFLRFSVILS